MLAVVWCLHQKPLSAYRYIHRESLHYSAWLTEGKPRGLALMVVTDKFKDIKSLSNSTSGSSDKGNNRKEKKKGKRKESHETKRQNKQEESADGNL